MDRPTLTQVLDLWVQRPTATLSSLRVGGGVPRLQIKSITDPGSELKLAQIILSDGKNWVAATMDQRWTQEVQKQRLKELDIIDVIETTGGMTDLVIVSIKGRVASEKYFCFLRGKSGEVKKSKWFLESLLVTVPSCR